MQRLIKALEDIMVAVTFAEAGEYDQAKKLSQEPDEQSVDVRDMKANEA